MFGLMRCRWFHPVSFGTLGCAVNVVLFIRIRCGSLGSSRVVGFTRVCPGGRCVHPWWLGSLGCALGVVGFIRGRLVHSGAPWGSLGSSGSVWFARERPVWRWVHAVHSRSLGSLGCVMGVVGLIRGRCVHGGAPLGSSCVVGFTRVYLCSSRVVRFIRVCPRGRWVHPGRLGSLVGFIRGGTRVRPGGRLFHPGWLGSPGSALGVVGFILGR